MLALDEEFPNDRWMVIGVQGQYIAMSNLKNGIRIYQDETREHYQEIEIVAASAPYEVGSYSINKDEAIQIIQHLTEQFQLNIK